MFPNVPRNKNRTIKKQQQQQRVTKDNNGVITSSDNLLVTNNNKKWSHCFRAERKATSTQSQKCEAKEQPLSEVPTWRAGFNPNLKKNSPLWSFDKLNLRKNCTAINDKITSEQHGTVVCTSESSNCLRTRGNSDLGDQRYWISSIIKDSLKRTLSLQGPSKLARANLVVNGGRKDTERSFKVKKNSKSSTNRGSRFAKANRHFKCLLSSHVTKIDSWLSSITLLFIIINVILFGWINTVVVSAPIPTPRVQPIWLLDGLISLDPNAVDSDGDLQTSYLTPSLNEISIPNQELLRLKAVEPNQQAYNLLSSKVNQPSEPTYYDTERPIIGRDRDSWYPTSDALEAVDPPEQPKDELVWLQRRRLDRDRALEPPPWLRVRPMRRVQLSSSAQSDSEIQPIVVLENEKFDNLALDDSSSSGADIKPRQVRGRISRESPDEIYQGIIEHIVDQALGDSSLLDQLYDELETKVKPTKNPSKSSARLQQQRIGVPDAGSDEVQGTQDQDEENLSRDTITQDTPLQESDPDATIVVVGDEVSSGDDVTALDSFANLRSSLNKAGFTDLGTSNGNNQNDDTRSTLDRFDPSIDFVKPQASLARGSISPIYNTQNLGQSASLLADPNIQVSESSMAQYQPNSFHVLEDVDRLDTAQDLPSLVDVNQQRQPDLQQFPSKLSSWLEKSNPTFNDEGSYLNINSKRNNIFLSQQRSSLSSPRVPSTLRSLYNLEKGTPQVQSKDQLAISVIDRGYLTKNQLLKAATKLRNYLEDSIGLSRSSILGLYPLNNEELLIKIDQNKLTHNQLINMVTNYGFIRGYIVTSWRKGSKQSPLPLISAILRALASNQEEIPLAIETSESLTTQEVAPKANGYQLSPQLLNEYTAGYQLEGTSNMIKPTLAAYLEALLLEQSKSVALAAQQTELDENPASLGGERRWYNLDSRPAYLLALVGALLGALLAVKLLTRSSGAQVLRERFARPGSFKTLWSSYSDLVSGGPATGKEAEAGNLSALLTPKTDEPAPPPFNAEPEKESRGFTQLGRRLSALLRRHEKAEASCTINKHHVKGTPSSSNEIDEDALEDEDESEVRQTNRFRSSRSYIRSLVETLSKSRVAFSMNPTEDHNRNVNSDNSINSVMTKDHNPDLLEQKNMPSKQECSAVAQMDISGAHLILDYMEKHLEDKERLKREWLALNGRPGKPKLAQVLLQRLARVAMSDECLTRNRNPQVVPFDRNRVKLGGSWMKAPSDYINASYVHDDDLRKPTHIIAQGPTEQTSGHFWQMVWEQGVSVIVMLTRLNENGTKMCHCYWPANSASCVSTSTVESNNNDGSDGPSSGSITQQSTGSPPRELSRGDLQQTCEQQQQLSPPSDGRRVSVTSVFSAQGGKLIVANGDLANNVIYFEVELSSSTDGSGIAGSSSSTSDVKPVLKLEVHLVSEHVSSSDYLVRNMYLINRSTCETRTVTQFHYLDWPENGIPGNVRNFLEFRRKVHKSYRNLKSPILVHCSDGAGRSGTYTLIDIILERIRSGAKEIDPRATLEHLRDQRMGLCASQSQFEFVLVALAEEIQIILDALPH